MAFVTSRNCLESWELDFDLESHLFFNISYFLAQCNRLDLVSSSERNIIYTYADCLLNPIFCACLVCLVPIFTGFA